MKKIFVILVCLLLAFHAKSKHHKNLTGLKLVCSIGEKKHGFEFLNEEFFSEHIFSHQSGIIEDKGMNFHYLTDKKYVYLERVGSIKKIFITINRSSLYVNDNEQKRCVIVNIPLLEYFKKIKK